MPPTFLIRKVGKRISHRNTPIYSGKVFEIPKDFLQKVLWSEFGADAPTFNFGEVFGVQGTFRGKSLGGSYKKERNSEGKSIRIFKTHI